MKGGQRREWEQLKSTGHVSAVINHLQSNEMYSFHLCVGGEKGQYSGKVSAFTKCSQGARMAMAIISGIALAYHATGPEGDLDDSDNEREWLVTSL